jgi:hypothetical protein
VTARWDADLVVVGSETEGCLSAIAAQRAGARTLLVADPDVLLGGLLTEGGLAFVDRDSRHLLPPERSPDDGAFGRFLAEAGVPLVALEARAGDRTLARLLAEAGGTVVRARWTGVRMESGAIAALRLADGLELRARHFLDATPDADLAEACGLSFSDGFREYGLDRYLGVSPLPIVHGVTPEVIVETCRRLERDPVLEGMRVEVFGQRRFLDLERGGDYILVGPPHLGLAYQRWRDREGLSGPYPFEADGFNVAIVGPASTSWNGLLYFCQDLETLLRLSRGGADDFFQSEARRFERFLREGLGWEDAWVEMPRGMYVRQTRHAREVRHRLTLAEIAGGYDGTSVGTFCYYPDFRGFRAVAVPSPLTAHVILEAGLARHVRNLGLATRAGGYTAFAHSLCRLVQYNATLGTALGVAAALADDDLGSVPVAAIRSELTRQGILADDRAGLERNERARVALAGDPIMSLEHA